MRILGIPIVAAGIATSVYIRTSSYPPSDALRHLIARAGCKAAEAVALAPAYRGQIGYHARNDVNGDGVACQGHGFAAAEPTPDGGSRRSGGAKFLRP